MSSVRRTQAYITSPSRLSSATIVVGLTLFFPGCGGGDDETPPPGSSGSRSSTGGASGTGGTPSGGRGPSTGGSSAGESNDAGAGSGASPSGGTGGVAGSGGGGSGGTVSSAGTAGSGGSGSREGIELSTPSLTLGRGQRTWVTVRAIDDPSDGGAELTVTGSTSDVIAANSSNRLDGFKPEAGMQIVRVGDYPAQVAILASDDAPLATTKLTFNARNFSTGAVGTASLAVTVVEPHASDTPSWLALRAGATHVCGIRSDERTYCWTGPSGTPVGDGLSNYYYVPVVVAGQHAFTDLALGFGFTCGLTESEAYCWGRNGTSELGEVASDGTLERSLPQKMAEGLHFTQMAAGTGFACGLTTDRQAYCWGEQVSGALGDGVLATQNQWRAAAEPVHGDLAFTAIVAGKYQTCGLDETGKAYCWGANSSGEIGDGTNVARAEPVPVETTLSFTKLTAGTGVTCGIATDGTAYCWGAYWQIGNGAKGSTTEEIEATYVPTPVTTTLKFTAISAGDMHVCAITTDGAAYCWGQNDYGQLGIGSTASSSFDRQTTHAAVSGGHAFKMIAAGGNFTCGITTDEQALCWGENRFGELADGTDVPSNVPTPVLTF